MSGDATNEPALALDSVSLSYAGQGREDRPAALSGVRLSIAPGEQVALIGPSGAGKSSLLGLLNGTLVPTKGTVRVWGRDFARLGPGAQRAMQRRIGTVYQQHHLVPQLRVVHNVLAGRLGSWSTARALWSLLAWPGDARTAHDALGRVGIGETLWARTAELSVGQQQRVALARVLVQNPDAVLADEPVASLDPERAEAVLALLGGLCRETNKTLIVSLHQVDLARRHFGRVVGLRAGQIIFDGPPEHVTENVTAGLYQLTERGAPQARENFVGDPARV